MLMQYNLNQLLPILLLSLGMFLSNANYAQSSDCKPNDATSTACCASNAKEAESTSGCSPSSCRGAQTKFGEAKVITTLRRNLIALKANLETYKTLEFEERTYSVHALIGETDEESLQIITKEVQLIEDAFSENLDATLASFELPEQKAKQVQYLQTRIQHLQGLL